MNFSFFTADIIGDAGNCLYPHEVNTGFVIWKAKNENARKYKNVNSDDENGGVG